MGKSAHSSNKQGIKLLFKAVSDNNKEEVLKIIDGIQDLDATNEDDKTCLEIATSNNYFEVAEILLNHGADINAIGSYGITSLHIAAFHNNVKAAEFLLSHGANIIAKGSHGETPLHSAGMKNCQDVAEYLVSKVPTIDITDNNGATPFMVAVQCGSEDVAKILISHGANVNAQYEDDETILHFCAQKNNLEMIKFLMNHNINLNIQNNEGQTALLKAIFYNQPDTCIYLIENGADVNIQDKKGKSAIHDAAKYKRLNYLLEPLLQANANLNLETNNRKTPLHYAAAGGNVEAAEFLLSHGANIDATNESGKTPLLVALIHGKTKIADFLIQKGANVSIADDYSTLHLASIINDLDLVKSLVSHGASINWKNENGNEPPLLALILGHDDLVSYYKSLGYQIPSDFDENEPKVIQAVKYNEFNALIHLIKNGADIDEQSPTTGMTALHYAAKLDRKEMIMVFFNTNANPLIKDNNGNIPLDIAQQIEDPTIFKALNIYCIQYAMSEGVDF
ncbi:ankyrin repeat protein, putative [Trichomonas vaginalis G3]|uniref:Ankyrin repeat protein, putative n=1 Tax=Trichomonas vaginalis (strain ATCC PRA-98 / G3) TaxID=412133 RepID=A2D768_TRIV3|nr:spectrin binding [Trichomonas vaginalis G3]EAY23585.1 ankyrin repeat protein, putative [Trichomonas vaginalis G3]KAI5490082.1 spectrin binding [Trichomonas vaginalis G3]|eukprot:XP_001276833.1 ankyrin repeat protein [Trichomonas vaginalis G3]